MLPNLKSARFGSCEMGGATLVQLRRAGGVGRGRAGERGEGGRGRATRAIIIQGGCRGGAAWQSKPGGLGGWGEVGLAGEQGSVTPVSGAGVAVPVS